MNARRAVLWLYLFSALAGALTPIVSSLVTSKSMAAGILFRVDSAQGYCTSSSTLMFSQSYPYGSVRVFAPVKVGGGAAGAAFGFSVLGGNVTLDRVQIDEVICTVVVPALGSSRTYIYAPNYYTPTVEGADSWVWNDANKTVIVTRDLSGSFTVHWNVEADDVMWERVFPDSFLMLGLLALVTPVGLIVYYMSGGTDPLKAAMLVSLMALIGVAAIIIAHIALAL